MAQGVTVERVEGFAGPNGWQGLLVVELVVEVHGWHLHLALLTLLLRVTAIRAAQESKPRSNYSNRRARTRAPPCAALRPAAILLPPAWCQTPARGGIPGPPSQTRGCPTRACPTRASSSFADPQNREAKAGLAAGQSTGLRPYGTSRGPAHSC